MDYQLSPEELQLQKKTADFCQSKIAPRAQVLDRASRGEACGLMRENLKALARGGCLTPGQTPESLDMVAAYLAGEEIAKACPATYVSARASAFMCGGAFTLFGTDVQKGRFLPGLLTAEKIGALAYSEEQAGSDIAGISAEARPQDSQWLVSGTKNIVVNAPIADVFLVLAYIDRKAGAEKGLGLFIVEKDAAGLQRLEPVETMGLRGTPISGVSIHDCPAELLGDVPGKGFEQLNRILTMGTIGIAALCVGIGASCTEISTSHAKNRTAFGRRIGLHQDVGFKLADMFTYNDLARMLAMRAAWALNTGEPDAGVLCACAKLFASEAVTKVANWGMQIFSGHGYLAGTDMERLYRDAKFGEICEGTSELQRSLIARIELDRFL